MTSPPSCKKAGVGAGLDRRYIQPYVFRYAHAVYYSKTGLFCQDFGKTNYPVCPLTKRSDFAIIDITSVPKGLSAVNPTPGCVKTQ